MKDESTIYNLIVRGQAYVESITPEDVKYKSEQLARIVLRRLEHIYYKPKQLIKANEEEAWRNIEYNSSIVSKGSSVDEVIDQLTEFYKSNKTKLMGNMLYYSPFIIMLSIINMKRLKNYF